MILKLMCIWLVFIQYYYCPNFVCDMSLVSWQSYNAAYCEKTCVSQEIWKNKWINSSYLWKGTLDFKHGFDRVVYQPARKNI
jgi:hypothetical protein